MKHVSLNWNPRMQRIQVYLDFYYDGKGWGMARYREKNALKNQNKRQEPNRVKERRAQTIKKHFHTNEKHIIMRLLDAFTAKYSICHSCVIKYKTYILETEQ